MILGVKKSAKCKVTPPYNSAQKYTANCRVGKNIYFFPTKRQFAVNGVTKNIRSTRMSMDVKRTSVMDVDTMSPFGPFCNGCRRCPDAYLRSEQTSCQFPIMCNLQTRLYYETLHNVLKWSKLQRFYRTSHSIIWSVNYT